MRYGVISTKLICEKEDKKIEYVSGNRIIVKQGKIDEYIVVIKAEVENSEFNDFIKENGEFDLTIVQAIKNVVNGEVEKKETKIPNISFCKKFTTFDSKLSYANNITIVLTTISCEYEDIKFILESDKKEEYINAVIDATNESGKFISEAFKSIKKNIELNINSQNIEDFKTGLEANINNIGKLIDYEQIN
jgi:hypothetical protein